MISIITFLFIPLCIVSNGEQNCDSFTWIQIDDRELFEQTYIEYGGKKDPASSGAFLDPITNRIIFYDTDIRTIIHEIDHAKCIMENYTYEDRLNCHTKLDIRDQAEKSRNY